MPHYVLLSCGRKQLSLAPESEVVPQELYTSNFFAAKLGYVRRHCHEAAVLIISTKYYLIELASPLIGNYDYEIRGKFIYDNEVNRDEPVESTEQWAKRIAQQLQKKGANLESDKFTILAGANMANPLQGYLAKVELPLKGMRIGEQMALLKKGSH